MFSRVKHNPIELAERFFDNHDLSHITYDPHLIKGDYYIIRNGGGDGTMLFTVELMAKALDPLVNKYSYFKPETPDFDKIKGVEYIVGSVKHSTVYGKIKLRCSDRPIAGQRDRVRIPVIAKFIY